MCSVTRLPSSTTTCGDTTAQFAEGPGSENAARPAIAEAPRPAHDSSRHDITTHEQYRDQRRRIESQLRSLAPRQPVLHLPNLERGAQLLQDLPALWVHEGVSDQQREEFVGELFATASINGNTLVALEPKMQYGPLFAYLVADGVRKCRGEWSRKIYGLRHSKDRWSRRQQPLF